MPKKPLNSSINKEDMFKKIMPSAARSQSKKPKAPAAGGDDLIGNLMDDLIEQASNPFEDDLIEQLPASPRVFAAPAAPTAPVPAPPGVGLPPMDGEAPKKRKAPPRRPPRRKPAPPPDPDGIQDSGFDEDPGSYDPEASYGQATVMADSATIMAESVTLVSDAAPQTPAPPPDTPPAAEQPEPLPEENAHPFQATLEVPDAATGEYDLPPLSPASDTVINVTEKIALDWLDHEIIRLHCCNCEKCRMDVAALTLNHLPPEYILIDQLRDEMLHDRRKVASIVTALVKSVIRVKMSPRH